MHTTTCVGPLKIDYQVQIGFSSIFLIAMIITTQLAFLWWFVTTAVRNDVKLKSCSSARKSSCFFLLPLSFVLGTISEQLFNVKMSRDKTVGRVRRNRTNLSPCISNRNGLCPLYPQSGASLARELSSRRRWQRVKARNFRRWQVSITIPSHIAIYWSR